MADTIRTFIATAIPDFVLAAIHEVQESIRRHGFNIRWVRPGNIHLTLKFLGDVSRQDVDRIAVTMVETVKPFPPISLSARGVGVFPSIKRPRVLWVGLDGQTEPLVRLQKALDEGLGAIGFPREARPFKGHLTLGRVKGRIDSRKLGAAIDRFSGFESETFRVDRIHLLKSDLKPAGAIYTRLNSAELMGTESGNTAHARVCDQ